MEKKRRRKLYLERKLPENISLRLLTTYFLYQNSLDFVLQQYHRIRNETRLKIFIKIPYNREDYMNGNPHGDKATLIKMSRQEPNYVPWYTGEPLLVWNNSFGRL